MYRYSIFPIISQEFSPLIQIVCPFHPGQVAENEKKLLSSIGYMSQAVHKDDQDGSLPEWKLTKMEDNQNQR